MHWRCIECTSERSSVKWSPDGRAYIATRAARRCIGTEQATQLQAACGLRPQSPCARVTRTVCMSVLRCFCCERRTRSDVLPTVFACVCVCVCVCVRAFVEQIALRPLRPNLTGVGGWCWLIAQVQPLPPKGSEAPPPMSEFEKPEVLDQYIGERTPLRRHREHLVHAAHRSWTRAHDGTQTSLRSAASQANGRRLDAFQNERQIFAMQCVMSPRASDACHAAVRRTLWRCGRSALPCVGRLSHAARCGCAG